MGTNQAFLFKADRIKDTVVNMLHRTAEFSGVDVLSYVVMDNHFHLCMRVPEKGIVSEDEVLRRVGLLRLVNFSISFWSMAHGIGLANGDAAFLKLDALKRSRCVVVQYAPKKPTTISVSR